MFLLAAVFCLAAAPGLARTLHVDTTHPAASDEGQGTADQPYKTIGRAVLFVEPGDTILIKPGTYPEGNIAIRRSGTRENPITIMAESPGTVIITGGERRLKPTRQEYPLLIGPPQRNPKNQELWLGAEWITLRGLVLRDAVGTAVGASTGWLIEDCFIDRPNYVGIDARGDDIIIRRTVVQDAGNCGMAGGFGKNILIEDCILRRNNQFPDSPGGNAGGSKFLFSQGMRVERIISYDNFGPGWWMDWDNSDYIIRGCTLFANHAGKALENGTKLLDQPWAAPGVWSEGNTGQGQILDNVIYSNVSPGIGIFDSRNVIVRGNTIVDCGTGIEFRDLNRDGSVPEQQRTRNIHNIIVEHNRIKAWRGEAAMLTSIGEFKRGDRPADYNVTINHNIYDPRGSEDKGLFRWMKRTARTLEEARQLFGIEADGRIEHFDFPHRLIKTYSTGEEELNSTEPDRFRQVDSRAVEASGFDEVLTDAKEGDVVTLNVHGRTPGVAQHGSPAAMECEIYDLARKRHIKLVVNTPHWQAVSQRIPEYAVLDPIELKVRLLKKEPYAIEATLAE